MKRIGLFLAISAMIAGCVPNALYSIDFGIMNLQVRLAKTRAEKRQGQNARIQAEEAKKLHALFEKEVLYPTVEGVKKAAQQTIYEKAVAKYPTEFVLKVVNENDLASYINDHVMPIYNQLEKSGVFGDNLQENLLLISREIAGLDYDSLPIDAALVFFGSYNIDFIKKYKPRNMNPLLQQSYDNRKVTFDKMLLKIQRAQEIQKQVFGN